MSKKFNSNFGYILENKMVDYTNGELCWKNIPDDLKLIGCLETIVDDYPCVYDTIGLQNKDNKIIYICHYLARIVENYSIYWLHDNKEWNFYNNIKRTSIEKGILDIEIKEHKKRLKNIKILLSKTEHTFFQI
jgi:hypothetical protein